MKKFIFGLIIFAVSINANGWENYKKRTMPYQQHIHGWCSKEKAEKMMDLVQRTSPKICVEIGVFGGSSVYPMAKALKYLNKGKIYAIDPWKNNECTDGYSKDDPNAIWWNNQDLERMYKYFINTIIRDNKLSDFCHTMRMTSKEASFFFKDDSIDILHIDGNHSEEKALFDAKTWLPKVKKGGYIWFDDCNWASTAQALKYLEPFVTLRYEESLEDMSCLLFRKN